MTHICVGKLTTIGSDNGLSPDRRQAIIWTNAGILLIGPLGTIFSEILIEILTFSLKKMRLKVSSAKRRLSCLGPNGLIVPSDGLKCMEEKAIGRVCLAPQPLYFPLSKISMFICISTALAIILFWWDRWIKELGNVDDYWTVPIIIYQNCAIFQCSAAIKPSEVSWISLSIAT